MTSRRLTWKQLLKLETSAFLITTITRMWFSTVRVQLLNPEVYDTYFKNPATGNVVAGSWHRHAIFLFYFFRKLGARGLMVSRSKDGDLTARIARRLGYTPIRGSSSKGGGEALSEMVKFLQNDREKRLCGTAVDGPKGPARQLKKGMLVLAKDTGSWFVPMACSGTRVFTFSRAWDRTIVPKPFSKIVIDFEEPVFIPPDISENQFETIRIEMENQLNRMTDKVDRICGYSPPA
ncbi:MAG: lysophospholipid acyltransferase family protein [Thermodesulfobacteriota bacterium]